MSDYSTNKFNQKPRVIKPNDTPCREAYNRYLKDYNSTFKKPFYKRGLLDIPFGTNQYIRNRPRKLSYNEYRSQHCH